MTLENRPTIRYHRVTTRRRSLRALQCPLEPELLVAEFSGELPPDIALAVREHIAVCDICGARSHALRQPYELLASLGSEPVHYVPDLRDTVRTRAKQGRFARNLVSAALSVGRGGALALGSALGALALITVLIIVMVSNSSAQPITRSANKLAHPGAAASSGTLYVETDKLVTVTDASGVTRQVAEVLLVRQQDGSVIRSIPTSSQELRTASSSQLPLFISVAPDGSYVLELYAASSDYSLIAIDSASGSLRYVAPVRLPGGARMPSGVVPVSMSFTEDGSALVLGLRENNAVSSGLRALTINPTSGAALGVFAPNVTSPAPMPQEPGGLPIISFPNAAPTLDLSSLTNVSYAEGANGAVATSPDGLWFYDLLIIRQNSTATYGLIRRIDATTGQAVQELAIQGDFTLARFVVAGSNLILIKGSPSVDAFVIDTTAKGPKLLGNIALGGPSAPVQTTFSGTLTASVSADETILYVSQDVSAERGLITGHDIWAVNLQSDTILTHHFDQDAAGAVLSNGVQGSDALTFVLRLGQVLVAQPGLRGATKQWLVLSDGHPVLALLASQP